eukprot:TRINITY_DN31737_c0_g1_i1.p2 TRINITY_DN31737_c0_g1~~TRINITY_DN31737_c0_g1_i1.p2  ORF type:complete len:122 (+),score=50.51 TRINITY_DN31737_c0_g1_i1:120-485(+)
MCIRDRYQRRVHGKNAKSNGRKKRKKQTKQTKVIEQEEESGDENQDQQQQLENLKKKPFLLKDGDIIGYRLASENKDKVDDFQTEDDQIMKLKLDTQRKDKQISQRAKKNDSQAFKIKVDF